MSIRLPLSLRFLCMVSGASIVVLTACTVGPDYQKPQVDIPKHWLDDTPKQTTGTKQDLRQWWRGFQDKRLDWLIERALLDNLDLKAARTRIQAARAQITATEAQRWPSVNASSAYQRQRISPNALLGALGSIQGGSNGKNSGLLSTLGPIGTPYNLFQAGFDASWELDFFGGIRRHEEAAEANAEAIAESLNDIQVSLGAEVARLYLELRGLQCRLGIAEDRLKTQRELNRLAEANYQEGFASALDRQRVTSELSTVKSTISPLTTQINNTRHALATLLGLPPGGLEKQLADLPLSIPLPPSIQPGLPAEILQRRPDIRQAERTVAAASAAIGGAVAELFPKISLTGAAGFQSQDLSNFTSLSSGFYGFGPHISLPIFQAGRLLANINAQEQRHKESLALYDKTVLTALREVEDNLASLQGVHNQQEALERAEQTAAKAALTALAYYQEGEVDLQVVLDTRLTWHESREQLIQSQLAWATGHVALFKALGGGWGY